MCIASKNSLYIMYNRLNVISYRYKTFINDMFDTEDSTAITIGHQLFNQMRLFKILYEDTNYVPYYQKVQIHGYGDGYGYLQNT